MWHVLQDVCVCVCVGRVLVNFNIRLVVPLSASVYICVLALRVHVCICEYLLTASVCVRVCVSQAWRPSSDVVAHVSVCRLDYAVKLFILL